MRCPRCRAEILQSPCPQCGLVMPISGQPEDFSLAVQSESAWQDEHASSLRDGQGKIARILRAQEYTAPQRRDYLLAGLPIVPQSPDMPLTTRSQGGASRFRLSERQEEQLWGAGFSEIWWRGHDDRRRGKPVSVCEVASGQRSSSGLPSDLNRAEKALAQIGRHSAAPGLLEMYSHRGHAFFVFEAVEGESLLSRMRRTRQTIPEQEILTCCLLLTEGIEYFSHISPPLIHGRISPDHLVQTSTGWMLTNFSPVVANGMQQAIAGMDSTGMSFLCSAPDFIQGDLSARSDLYALLATAYYAVTRMIPSSGRGNIPQAQRINPTISARLNAILMKGLSFNSSQCYQYPLELRVDLEEAISGSRSVQRQQWVMSSSRGVAQNQQHPESSDIPDPVARALSFLAPDQELSAPSSPSISSRKDLFVAMSWLVALLICLLTIICISRGFI